MIGHTSQSRDGTTIKKEIVDELLKDVEPMAAFAADGLLQSGCPITAVRDCQQRVAMAH